MPKIILSDKDFFIVYHLPSSQSPFNSKIVLQYWQFWDWILQRPHCRSPPRTIGFFPPSRKHTAGTKTKSLLESAWRQFFTCGVHIWLLNRGRNVPCLFLKCLGNFVCAAIWHHTPLPIFQIFCVCVCFSSNFRRPNVVIERRQEIVVWRF